MAILRSIKLTTAVAAFAMNDRLIYASPDGLYHVSAGSRPDPDRGREAA